MAKPQLIKYDIGPTKLMPNSPKPLLLYKKAFLGQDGKIDPLLAFDTFTKNGWDVQWVTRYGRAQRSHYHDSSHETMIVLSGPGRIRWGAADLDDDPEKHTYGDAYEPGGIEIEVETGDLFVIPAGLAHKSFDPGAKGESYGCLTGDAHGIEADDPRKLVAELALQGFMMMGAYPRGFTWTWSEGGAHLGNFESIWSVETPDCDPLLGNSGGIRDHWEKPTTQC
ncbi:hypothetical protein VTK73DRAFT_5551 [Phialemonium thermophilum]|uniref:Cupin type-1 domain-containing protein n=1 Tax=Phialemonium thermophilum TaxID=223376 RepID=A0ABR3XWZ9_9PEZI